MTNVLYVKNISANFDGNMYSSTLHPPRVELGCELHEKLRRVTETLVLFTVRKGIRGSWNLD